MELALSGMEKAALLLVSIDKSKSAEIFKQLKEDEIQRLTYHIATTKPVTKEMQNTIALEFYEMCLAQGYINGGGIEYAKEVLTEALGTQKCMDIIGKIASHNQNKPFSFLDDVDAGELLNILKFERNQTLALVMTYMDSEQAATVLASLEEDRQADIVQRIAKIGKISPEVVTQIEEEIKSRISTFFGPDSITDTMGINIAADILSAIDRSAEVRIFNALEVDNVEMAEEIRKQMFIFEDIVNLDRKTVQVILAKVPNKDLAMALKSTTDAVSRMAFENISQRVSEILHQEMDLLGKVRLGEVLEAQQKVVSLILEMERTQEIVISKGDNDKLVG